jgi:hypothetical protein
MISRSKDRDGFEVLGTGGYDFPGSEKDDYGFNGTRGYDFSRS